MKEVTLAITTHVSDGTATVYSERPLLGYLHAIRYTPTTIATGATVTITCGTDTKPLLTKATAGTAVAWFYPRDFAHAVADGAALTDRTFPILDGKIKVAIASGGNSKVGTVTVYYEE